jgi:glycosyltransferase involved in cell wall biosynthesis
VIDGDEHRPLRVALLSPCYWPEVRRGTERFARDLATELLARGQQPSLITSHPRLPTRRTEDGLPVLRLPRPPQRALEAAHFESYLTHVPLTYLALRAGTSDIAHALYPTDAVAAARWRRRTGRPALLSYMGIPAREWLDAARGRRAILRRAIAQCDRVVVLSRHAAEALAQSLGHEARVIPPGVDLKVFKPARARAQSPTLLCSAAPEVPRKNVGLLIAAFASLRRRIPEARLVLSRPRDPAAARRAGVDLEAEGVEWVDLDDRESLARACAEAWVAVLPSVGEAFGLVLVEALACGTPVVGHAHGAIPEIIDSPSIGRLFEPLEPKPLERALVEALELASDPGTPCRCRARAAEFSTDRCADRYLALYRELVGS